MKRAGDAMPERSKQHATHDPFAITPDPNVYVPRAATETARKDLLRSACNPSKTTALIGPPGLGKTLLLHLLAEEVPETLHAVYLPYAALPPEELCSWALGLLGLPGSGDPIGDLQVHCRRLSERGSSLLLLIDDAGAMPVATARWAGGFIENSGGSVRLVIAASDNAAGNRTIAAIGCNFDIVHLDEPMNESETSKYIDGRLALARVPDSVRARFDAPTVRLLHRISAGIPRRLHSAATSILQEAPMATAEKRAEESKAPVDPRTAPVDAREEPAAAAQTLGVPAEERRVSKRRAEPEGVDVRVGRGGESDPRGRRAEDRAKPAPASSASAATESDASAPIESDESAPIAADGSAPFETDEIAADAIPEREPSIAPPPPRRPPPVSRRAIAMGTFIVAFAAVAIPVIRSILSETHQIARADRRADLRESVPGGLEGSAPEDFGEPARGDVVEPSARLEPEAPIAREEARETRVEAATGARSIAEPSVADQPAERIAGPFAVQINATPWANVEVDGIDLGATPLANIPLIGGEHAFRVKLPDGRTIERTIEIDAERRFISFE